MSAQGAGGEILGGRYRIVREIARSNDIVYEALDVTMGRRVAVKELLIPPNLDGAARRDRVERFNREARAAARLSHPNVVTIYDHREEAGRYYIAMEFLEGSTLRDLIQTRGALPITEAAEICSQVLAALSHAHSKSVIHRDVKPDNIHILPGNIVKLTDFGIARIAEETSLTAVGQVFGTPSYMSPEQVRGGALDPRTDLFSAGVVLYEMLTGRKPFTGDNVASVTHSIVSADPTPLVGVPAALAQATMRALRKFPSERFATAAEMMQALRAASDPSATSTRMTGAYPSSGVYGTAAPVPTAVLTHGQPAPTTAISASGQPSASPFADWGGGPPVQSRAGVSPTVVPSTHPGPRQRRPMSAAARAAILTFVISLCAIGLAFMFVSSYDEQKRQGVVESATQQSAEAEARYRAGDLEGAAALYRMAVRTAPGTQTSAAARTSLATVLNKLGERAYHNMRYADAIGRFEEAAALYTDHRDIRSESDRTELQHAQDGRDSATRLANTGGAPAGAPTQGAGGDSVTGTPGQGTLAARSADAQRLLYEGDRLLQAGDTRAARDAWTQAVTVGVGTEAGTAAQERLNQVNATVRSPGQP